MHFFRETAVLDFSLFSLTLLEKQQTGAAHLRPTPAFGFSGQAHADNMAVRGAGMSLRNSVSEVGTHTLQTVEAVNDEFVL